MKIHYYSRLGDIENISKLLECNVDIESRDLLDQTPLMAAAESRNAGAHVIRFLISKGADVNAIIPTSANYSVLHLAVQQGDPDKISVILDAGADIHYKTSSGIDALISLMYGRDIANNNLLIQSTKLLLEKGAKVDTKSSYNESALRAASTSGRFDVVQLLLNAGAPDEYLQWTPLMKEIVFGEIDTINDLLNSGASLTDLDSNSRTPFLLCVQTGDIKKVRYLLSRGANINENGRGGRSAIFYLLNSPKNSEQSKILKLLLDSGLDLDKQSDFGDTALMEAAEKGNYECALTLLDAGADITKTNQINESAIKLASTKEIVWLLVNAGSDLNDSSIEMKRALKGLYNEEIELDKQAFIVGRDRVFGTTNPQLMEIPFWNIMIKSGRTAGLVELTYQKEFNDITEDWDRPIWCYQRYGQTFTALPDGRFIEIGGEHEDYYDSNFCIYNDVVVSDGNGNFEIYGYPKEDFPPTDFHTATLVRDYIYIIGNLSYPALRKVGHTQVYKLNINTFQITKVETTGDNPGWISKHKAKLDNSAIKISGGKICANINGKEEYIENNTEYCLDLMNLSWSVL